MRDDGGATGIAWRDRVRERLAGEGVDAGRHPEIVDEISEHLAQLYRGRIRAGDTSPEAAAHVEKELVGMGPLARTIERRSRRRSTVATLVGWCTGLDGDARLAVRMIARERAFAGLAIVTLAIGIGAAVSVFSLINALLWRSLPYPHPEQLVLALETNGSDRTDAFIVAQPVYEDWTRETRSFQALGIWEYGSYNVASAQEPEQVQGIRASASLFDVLGIAPARGRVFTPEEEGQGHRVVVISDAVWRVHLGGQESAIGTTIRLNGEAFEVIGVMPPGFAFPRAGTGIWVPAAFTDQDRQRGAHSFWVAGRLRSAVSFEAARAEIEQVGEALAQRYDENRNEGSTLRPMQEQGLGSVRTMLRALMGAVLLVLVIACINVANLQVARALARRREYVVRLALGAGLSRLARQLVVESVALSIAGGFAGLVVAWLAVRSADLVLSPGFRALPFRGEVPITIDVRALLFTGAISLACALVFGLVPLIGLRRQERHGLLRQGGRGSTMAGTARRVLVTLEVAMATIVLCGAGLLVKSLSGLLAVNPGFNPQQVLTLQVSLPQANTYGPPVRESFCADLAGAAAGQPGILEIGAISHLPLTGANAGRTLTVEGRAVPTAQDAAQAGYRLTCPGYFRTLEIPVLEGRDFSDRDVTRGLPVAIVNRTMATQYWPGKSPLGQRVKLGTDRNDTPWLMVVGVVEDVKHFGLDVAARRELYLPYSQSAWPVMTLVVRTRGEPRLSVASVRAVIGRIDPSLPVASVLTMEDVLGASVRWREAPMRLLSAFAAIGLLLASIGVYGVLAYYISQRSRELGVRAALGATGAQLARLVVGQSLVPLGIGLALGIAGSIVAGGVLQQLLYEVRPGDPQVIGAIVLLMSLVGALAGWLPARRAAALDPVVALKED